MFDVTIKNYYTKAWYILKQNWRFFLFFMLVISTPSIYINNCNLPVLSPLSGVTLNESLFSWKTIILLASEIVGSVANGVGLCSFFVICSASYDKKLIRISKIFIAINSRKTAIIKTALTFAVIEIFIQAFVLIPIMEILERHVVIVVISYILYFAVGLIIFLVAIMIGMLSHFTYFFMMKDKTSVLAAINSSLLLMEGRMAKGFFHIIIVSLPWRLIGFVLSLISLKLEVNSYVIVIISIIGSLLLVLPAIVLYVMFVELQKTPPKKR